MPNQTETAVVERPTSGEVTEPRMIIAAGRGKVGKAQPHDALVLTPSGFRPIGSLSVGDLVTCPDGKSAAVTDVFPQGEKDIFQVEFHDGRTVECCDDHLWKIWNSMDIKETGKSHSERKSIASGRWEVKPLSEVRLMLNRGKASARRARWAREIGVPLVAPCALELPPQNLPVPPYTLGTILANGGLTNPSIIVTTPDGHVMSRIEDDLPDYQARPTEPGGISFRLKMRKQAKVSPLRLRLEELGLMGLGSPDKHVPPVYKAGLIAHRIALLQGMLDGDGSAGECHATFSSTSEQLAKDVQEIAWSLGAIASIRARQTYHTYKGVRKAGRPSWRVSIIHPDASVLFSPSSRKMNQTRARIKDTRLRIASIKPVGRKDATCIAIDHPDSLYVTNNYIVTHNSTVLRYLIEETLSRGGEPTIADADRTNPTLKAFFPHASRPASAENDDVRLWLNDLVDTQIEKRTTVFLDLGGGDQMLKQWSRELDLAAFLSSHGVTPVLLHLLGSDLDDLAYVRDLETVYAPELTALVLNEGMVPAGRSAQSVFQPVVADPIFQAAVKRGAVVVHLPRLGCMQEVDGRRLLFAEAADRNGQGRLPPTMRQMVTLWRRDVPEALKPILGWVL